ncbi:MAG: protein kinase [Myxococcaceae bacterium]|nr:protein kinase [Myxococcaceae bacterium]MCA3016269.1 protein kinase [Myxococcaceae bacterium]
MPLVCAAAWSGGLQLVESVPMGCPACRTKLERGAVSWPACGWEGRTAASARHGAVEIIDGKGRLERELGRGGMGTVHVGYDLDLGRRVAITMLSKHLTSEPELVARFESEVRIMARLDHLNLVPIYAVCRHDGLPFNGRRVRKRRRWSRYRPEPRRRMELQ